MLGPSQVSYSFHMTDVMESFTDTQSYHCGGSISGSFVKHFERGASIIVIGHQEFGGELTLVALFLVGNNDHEKVLETSVADLIFIAVAFLLVLKKVANVAQTDRSYDLVKDTYASVGAGA